MQKNNTNKISALLKKLDDGKNVSVRDLRTALGDDGVSEYERRWQEEKARRAEFARKPKAVKDYEDILKKADFANNKADGIKITNRSKRDQNGMYSNERLRGVAESLYEDALERVQEIVSEDANMRIWFDRDIDNTVVGTLNADMAGVPRVVTSRGSNKITSGAASALSKESIKRELLEDALGEVGLEDTGKLKDMLAKLKREK
jgi:hypothetical protein